MKRKMHKLVWNIIMVLLFITLSACQDGGGGGGGDETAEGVCEQVSQGNSTVKIVNSSGSMISVYFGISVAFGADIASGECNLVGIEIPSYYTLDTQVEINQCTPDPKGGCGEYYGTTKYVPLTLNQGQEKTITVGSDFFN
jgi:hypothetical protein